MKNKIKYVLSAGLLLQLVIVALLAPQGADLWYDGKTLGQMSGETMAYQSCEITPYHSFSDQTKSIAKLVTEGASPFAVELREREDAPGDQELVAIANKELEKLYEAEILPYPITIEELYFRKFSQLYAVPGEGTAAVMQDICFWTLSADTEWGNVTIALDRNFYKIYGLVLSTPSAKYASDLEGWMKKQGEDLCFFLTSAWCSYWQLQDAEVENPFSDTYVQTTDVGSNANDVSYDEENDYRILLSEEDGCDVWNRLLNPLVYGKKGDCMMMTGMGVLLEVM